MARFIFKIPMLVHYKYSMLSLKEVHIYEMVWKLKDWIPTDVLAEATQA